MWPIIFFNTINTLPFIKCSGSYIFIQNQNIITIFCWCCYEVHLGGVVFQDKVNIVNLLLQLSYGNGFKIDLVITRDNQFALITSSVLWGRHQDSTLRSLALYSEVVTSSVIWGHQLCTLGSPALYSGVTSSVLWGHQLITLGSPAQYSGVTSSVLWGQQFSTLVTSSVLYSGVTNSVLWGHQLSTLLWSHQLSTLGSPAQYSVVTSSVLWGH